MEFLTVGEKIEMILIYGEAGRNLDDAVDIYAQLFPDKIQSRTSFRRTVKQFTTNGSVQPKKSLSSNRHSKYLDASAFKKLLNFTMRNDSSFVMAADNACKCHLGSDKLTSRYEFNIKDRNLAV
ncbi:unnamed protein product [Brassicogethes aeneus]|uniref:DUF4817 domain-containing protein n=1 Tax=Brassicogethes aeneus TaxID=1431903 RepID=A0A9P0FAM1_BRAAE|nr:unnamed protein product [Brassicogethes aeneus]